MKKTVNRWAKVLVFLLTVSMLCLSGCKVAVINDGTPDSENSRQSDVQQNIGTERLNQTQPAAEPAKQEQDVVGDLPDTGPAPAVENGANQTQPAAEPAKQEQDVVGDLPDTGPAPAVEMERIRHSLLRSRQSRSRTPPGVLLLMLSRLLLSNLICSPIMAASLV